QGKGERERQPVARGDAVAEEDDGVPAGAERAGTRPRAAPPGVGQGPERQDAQPQEQQPRRWPTTRLAIAGRGRAAGARDDVEWAAAARLPTGLRAASYTAAGVPEPRLRTYGLLVLVVVIWGSYPSLVKLALRDMPPFTLAALRCLLASAILAVLFWRSAA